MGDSGAEDTSDSLTDEDLDQIAKDAQAIQDERDSGAEDTTDSLTAADLDLVANRAGGDDSQTFRDLQQVDTPSGLPNIFDQDLETMTGRRDTAPKGLETGAVTPEARGTPSFNAFGDPITVQSFLPAAVTVDRLAPQTKQEQGLAALAQTLNQARDKGAGMGDPRGIDFGVTAPVDPSRGMAPQLSSQIAARDGKLTVGDVTPGLREFTKGVDDEIAARSMPGTAADFTQATGLGISAIPTQEPQSPGRMTAQFGQKMGSMASGFSPELSQALGRFSQAPLDAEQFGIFGRGLGFVEQLAKDKIIEDITSGKFDPIYDADGNIVGSRNPDTGVLQSGRDPNAQEQRADDNETQAKKKTAKKPDDPCPEGYQLIDGKCTIIEDPSEGTGFIRFPTDRDPPFKKGPFSPTTVATPATGIRALNPITFTLPPNPFKT